MLMSLWATSDLVCGSCLQLSAAVCEVLKSDQSQIGLFQALG